MLRFFVGMEVLNMRVRIKGKRRKCFCGTETNRKFCPKCGKYAPIKVVRACPDCKTITTSAACPNCEISTVNVDKDGYFNANERTRICPYYREKTVSNKFVCLKCGKQTIDIRGANWKPMNDVHLFLKNFFARFFKKCTMSF